MTLLFGTIRFIFGTVIGSFFNVLILRYQPEQNIFAPAIIGGRSHCPYCKKTLHWFELIPILSFLFQAGRCRTCQAKLSIQYPIVEFLAGAIFVLVPSFLKVFYRLDFNFVYFSSIWFYLLIAIWLLAFLTWLLIVVIDIRHYLIPDELNLVLFVLGLLILIFFLKNGLFYDSFLKQYGLLFSFGNNPFLNHVLGAVIGGLFFGSISVLSGGRAMGFGDAKLAFASGLLLGWPDIGLAVILSFLIGGLFGAITLATGKKTMKGLLPFAPFFVLGVVLTVFFGAQILNLYFRLFQIG